MMEIEASIPPIKMYLEYKLDMEALHLSCLDDDHPIITRAPPDLHHILPNIHPSPALPHHTHHRNPRKTRKTPLTCISCITNGAQDSTERIWPLAMAPWHNSNPEDGQ